MAEVVHLSPLFQLPLSRILRFLIHLIAVDITFLLIIMEADPENDFLQLSYTRHILERSCSLQVDVMLVKFRTPYSECFLSDRLVCEHRYACVSVCSKVVACFC